MSAELRTCARCGEKELGIIDGYCSLYCRDMAKVESDAYTLAVALKKKKDKLAMVKGACKALLLDMEFMHSDWNEAFIPGGQMERDIEIARAVLEEK